MPLMSLISQSTMYLLATISASITLHLAIVAQVLRSPIYCPMHPPPFDALDFSPLTTSNYAFSMGEGAGFITGINIGNNFQMKYSRGSNAHLTDYPRTNFDIDSVVQRLLTQKKITSVATNPTINVAHGMIYRLRSQEDRAALLRSPT